MFSICDLKFGGRAAFGYVTAILKKQNSIIFMSHTGATNARMVKAKGRCAQFKLARVLAFLLVFGASYLAGGLPTHGRSSGACVTNSINA